MANTPLNNITIDGKLYDVLNAIPTEQNKLLYSFDNQTLKADYLMYTDGLVVNNNDDFELCKEGADVSMSTVSSTWVKWGNSSDASEWGYYSSDGSKTGELMANEYKFTDFYLNGEPEGYIYNTKNTTHYTGYYSPNKFKDYDSHIAMGIMSKSSKKPYLSSSPTLNDYMAVLPVFNVINENGTTTYYGITVSVMNASEQTNSRNIVSGSGSHTISIECYSLTDLISNTGTVLSLLNDNIGKTIIAYNETFNNSSSTGLASVIQTKIKKHNDVITLWFSEPYSTYDNDGEHQVYGDRPVIIDLNQYNITYTDMSGNTSTIDFTSNSSVINIFDKLRGGARRGYEVFSNPGSIFRNITSDELILNMSPDENFNTTWKFYQSNGWTNETQTIGTPMQLFSGSKLSFNRITNKLFYSDGTDITYIGNISSGSTNEGGNTISDLMINVTYENLKNLKDVSGLTPGMQYRLTDYECTVNIKEYDWESLVNKDYAKAINKGHFDIILVADDESTLNENVRFTHHEGDTYFAGCNLSAWEGKYTIYNDTNKFNWAYDTNSKGVIYWLKDEWGNECPYDFKNIQFKRVENEVENWYYTFNFYNYANTPIDGSIYYNNGGGDSSSVPKTGVKHNVIKPLIISEVSPGYSINIERYKLPIIIFHSNDDIIYFEGFMNNSFGYCCDLIFSLNGTNSNTFGNYCNNIIFGKNTWFNTFRNNCCNNTFGNNCCNNTFGNYCYGNILGDDFQYNTFGNNCYENTFGKECYYNTFVNNCWGNTFRKNCNSNTFGNDCYGNILGDDFQYNTFGNNCYENTFGKECYYNTFGNNCWGNTFGESFQSNTFRNYCYENTFGNDYIKDCRFCDGISYCSISGITTSNLNYLQNITFLSNIKGDSNSKQNLNENNYLSNNIDSENISYELFCGFDKNNVYKCKTMFDSML